MPRPRLPSGRSPFSTCTTTGLNVAASGIRLFRKPSALGPRTAMSNSRAMSAISRWRTAPASPRSSPNPELMTTAAFTPLLPHARRVAATCSAGMVMMARSTGPGSASTEGWQGMPAISRWLRLTAWSGPSNPCRVTASTMRPRMIVRSGDTPTRAIERGRNRAFRSGTSRLPVRDQQGMNSRRRIVFRLSAVVGLQFGYVWRRTTSE